MAGRLVPFALLSGASVVTLPVLYLLTRPDLDLIARPTALALGGLSMGLAWAAGASLEDRRKGSVMLLGVGAVISPAVVLVPGLRDSLGPMAIAALVISGVLSLIAMMMLRTRWSR